MDCTARINPWTSSTKGVRIDEKTDTWYSHEWSDNDEGWDSTQMSSNDGMWEENCFRIKKKLIEAYNGNKCRDICTVLVSLVKRITHLDV